MKNNINRDNLFFEILEQFKIAENLMFDMVEEMRKQELVDYEYYDDRRYEFVDNATKITVKLRNLLQKKQPK